MGSIAALIADITNTSGKEFDAIGFYDIIYGTIKTYRSDYGLYESQIFRNAAELASSEKGSESIVNTFYRVIGFPAIRDDYVVDSIIKELSKIKPIDDLAAIAIKNQDGTLNYVSGISSDISKIFQREAQLGIRPTLASSLAMIKEPCVVNNGKDSTRPTRPSIFPMKVLADIPVYPISKRMAPIFNDGPYITERSTRLSRCFIENAFYMRVFSTNFTDISVAIRTSIAKTFAPDKTTAELEEMVKSGSKDFPILNDLVNLNLLQLQITDKMIKAIKQSAIDFRDTLKVRDGLDQEITYVPQIKDSPQEKTGTSDMSPEEVLAGDPRFDTESFFVPVLDAQIDELQKAIAIINVIVQIAPTNGARAANQIPGAAAAIALDLNISPDVFVSEFIALASFEKTSLENSLQELKDQRARKLQNYEVIRKKIQIYSGEFVGLSIFDILSIFLALFTVDLNILLGLMNPEARARIAKSDFYQGQNQAGSTNTNINTSVPLISGTIPSTEEALQKFEGKVKEYLDLGMTFFVESAKSGQTKS